jgi:hypothetical protein
MTDTPFTMTADPEAINKWIADAILESTIGKVIRDAAIAKLGSWDFRREVENAVNHMVMNAARELVQNDSDLKQKITDAVAKELTPDLIEQLATKAVAKLDRY